MQPLRITHLIDTLQIGGAEVMLGSLAELQRASGNEVRVICLIQSGPLEERLRKSGVEVYRCRHNPLRQSLPGKLGTIFELRRELRNWGTHILHCHNITTTLYGGPAGRLAGVRGILCTRHGFFVPPHLVRKERAFWAVARVCCDRVVAVSDSGRNAMAALPYGRDAQIVTIPNGISPQEVTLVPEPGSGFTLVTVARLDPPKDHATLLQAIARIGGQIPDLRLLVVGGGSLESRLRELSRELGIERCVEFLGKRHDVGNWLARAHVFVLSSKSEGLPISMLEAMAAGLPMILSDVGGIREVAGGLPAVRLVRPEEPAEMASAILDFYSRRQEVASLGLTHRRYFNEHYSARRMSDAYARLYTDTCAKR
jgi:glycosyltransferase involved in cell wall biosynthesis